VRHPARPRGIFIGAHGFASIRHQYVLGAPSPPRMKRTLLVDRPPHAEVRKMLVPLACQQDDREARKHHRLSRRPAADAVICRLNRASRARSQRLGGLMGVVYPLAGVSCIGRTFSKLIALSSVGKTLPDELIICDASEAEGLAICAVARVFEIDPNTVLQREGCGPLRHVFLVSAVRCTSQPDPTG
jgi:hypothetical protein